MFAVSDAQAALDQSEDLQHFATEIKPLTPFYPACVDLEQGIVDQIPNRELGVAREPARNQSWLVIIEIDAGQRFAHVQFAWFAIQSDTVPVEHAVGGIGILLNLENEVAA